MVASNLFEMGEALQYIKEIDELSMKILVNSTCKDLDALAMLNLMEDKEPILAVDRSLTFNTTENYPVDLSNFLTLVS